MTDTTEATKGPTLGDAQTVPMLEWGELEGRFRSL